MFEHFKENLAARFQRGWRYVTFADAADTEERVTSLDPIPPLKTDSGPAARMGLFALVVGLGGFLLWAAFAPLDEGVPASGVVKVEGNRKAIQHLRGGIAEEILVREGSTVKSGDVLIRLNQTEIQAQLDITQAEYWTVLAIESRLRAEQAQKNAIDFPDDLKKASDPRAKEAVLVQTTLFRIRQEALRNEVEILQETHKGLQEQINGLESQQSGKLKQIQLLSNELNSLRELAKDGYMPQMKLLEQERLLADLSGSRGDDLAKIASTRNAIAETRLRIIKTQQDFQKETQTQLSEIQQQVSAAHDKLKALRAEVERATMRAPVDGMVVGLTTFTNGGVIQAGQVVMEIVPHGDKLLVEVQIPTNLIEKVYTGLAADIRFSTIKGSQMPPIAGKLVSVSADRLIDNVSKLPFYLGYVEVTPDGLSLLSEAKHVIQPGMQADVVIKTGERTMLQYLLNPLLNRIAGSMREI